jgi:hypothetical protein
MQGPRFNFGVYHRDIEMEEVGIGGTPIDAPSMPQEIEKSTAEKEAAV